MLLYGVRLAMLEVEVKVAFTACIGALAVKLRLRTL